AARVAEKLADPDQVARSRQFPFRFLAAYRATTSLRWAAALERALHASLCHVPALPGRTLILVDLSGSMQSPTAGALSALTRADAAKVFGAALALRAASPTLVWFDSDSGQVRVPPGIALLKLVD